MTSETEPEGNGEAPGSGNSEIHVVNLVHRYGEGSFGLSLPELHVRSGETIACIGPSGSGKSTFLNLLAGILLPTEGTVRVAGTEWAGVGEAQRRRARIRRIGLVFQEFELLDHLTVLENILLPYFVNPALRLDGAARDRARELARGAGIEEHLARKPRRLSQGERQRVAICRSLVAEPAVLLADEPTGNLDPETTDRVLELLLNEARAREATLVLVTHDHGLIERFDRVLDFADYARTSRVGAGSGAAPGARR